LAEGGQPRRHLQVRRRRLSRSLAAASARLVCNDTPVQPSRPGAAAGGTPAGCGVIDQADDTPAGRWLEFLARHGQRPWRHRPTREWGGHVHEDRHRGPLAADRIRSVGSWAEESFTVVGAPEVALARAEEHIPIAGTPGLFGVPTGALSSVRAWWVSISARNGGRSAGRIDPSFGRPVEAPFSSYSFQLMSIRSEWTHPGTRPMTSLHRMPVYATVMIITKSVLQPDRAAHRSATSRA
jgi:hypothetical protein